MSGGEPSSIKQFVGCAAVNLIIRTTRLTGFYLFGGSNMYQALYRKWRPARFDDVVGQENITMTLQNEVSQGQISHAYLFAGSRGTGKTTCAKILAKAVNCLNNRDGNPCGKCEMCTGIEDGAVLDVWEMDAASNNGVDDVRQLRETALMLPVAAKYRVYIIDEAHMLSQSAFNALLKLMEEPPSHVIFILATTELHKLPVTVLSRCQRFEFKRIETEKIAERLEYIASAENMLLTGAAASLIAKLSDGGMRDALSLLDLAASYSSSIDEDTVRAVAGISSSDILFDISDALMQYDREKVLSAVERASQYTPDYDRLCMQLIEHYRNLMIAKVAPKAENLISPMGDEYIKYLERSEDLSLDQIMSAISQLGDAAQRIARTTHRRTELEMALLRICMTDRTVHPDDELARRVSRLENMLSGKTLPAEQEKPRIPEPVQQTRSASENKAVAEPFGQWDQVLEIIQKKNPMLHGMLSQSKAYLSGRYLLIECPDPIFTRMMKENSFTKETLRDSIGQVTGRSYNLGPYNPEKYDLQNRDLSPLDKMLENAKNLGVDVREQ